MVRIEIVSIEGVTTDVTISSQPVGGLCIGADGRIVGGQSNALLGPSWA
jgi:hypothetical protein